MEMPVANSELERLRDKIKEWVEGGDGPDAIRSRCIIETLVKRYTENLRSPAPWGELQRICWATPESPGSSVMIEGSASDTAVRMAVARTRTLLKRYFLSPEGCKETIRLEIEMRAYRLRIALNSPAPADLSGEIRVSRSTTIGLLCALRSNWFNSELIAGAERAAREMGFRVVVAYSDGDLDDEAAQLGSLSKQCAGLVVVPVLDEYSRQAKDLHQPFLRLLDRRYPMVFVDRRVPGCEAPLVGCNNELGGVLATEHLLDAHGCTAVLVAAESGSSAAAERVASHRKVMRARFGGDSASQVEWLDLPEERGGFDYIKTLLASPKGKAIINRIAQGERFGLFATNDAILRGIRIYLDSAQGAGLPVSLPMVGFDGREFGHFMNPPLVSVKQDFFVIGAEAVRSAVKLITHRKRDEEKRVLPPPPNLSVRTPVKLLLRESVWPDADE